MKAEFPLDTRGPNSGTRDVRQPDLQGQGSYRIAELPIDEADSTKIEGSVASLSLGLHPKIVRIKEMIADVQPADAREERELG